MLLHIHCFFKFQFIEFIAFDKDGKIWFGLKSLLLALGYTDTNNSYISRAWEWQNNSW
jgi:prophage antirepressor-like protein